MASARRTIDRSTAQPSVADEDISQALPDDFDDVGFDQDIGAALDLDAASADDFQRHARATPGLVDRDLDSEIVAAGYDHEGIANRLKDAQSQTARILRGEVLPLSLRLTDVPGGVAIELRVGGVAHWRSLTMNDELAEALMPASRAALHAYAELAAPILARHAGTMPDPRIARAANDGTAASPARKLGGRA